MKKLITFFVLLAMLSAMGINSFAAGKVTYDGDAHQYSCYPIHHGCKQSAHNQPYQISYKFHNHLILKLCAKIVINFYIW